MHQILRKWPHAEHEIHRLGEPMEVSVDCGEFNGCSCGPLTEICCPNDEAVITGAEHSRLQEVYGGSANVKVGLEVNDELVEEYYIQNARKLVDYDRYKRQKPKWKQTDKVVLLTYDSLKCLIRRLLVRVDLDPSSSRSSVKRRLVSLSYTRREEQNIDRPRHHDWSWELHKGQEPNAGKVKVTFWIDDLRGNQSRELLALFTRERAMIGRGFGIDDQPNVRAVEGIIYPRLPMEELCSRLGICSAYTDTKAS